jgi:hypothetical protein
MEIILRSLPGFRRWAVHGRRSEHGLSCPSSNHDNILIVMIRVAPV